MNCLCTFFQSNDTHLIKLVILIVCKDKRLSKKVYSEITGNTEFEMRFLRLHIRNEVFVCNNQNHYARSIYACII